MQLHRARDRFEAAGCELVLIGMGSPRQAAWFRRNYAPELRILADEKRASYRATGLKEGSAIDLMGPKSVLSGVVHAARSGVVQGRPVGNVAQLGGALVVAAGGEVLLHHRAQEASDSAAVDSLLAAAGPEPPP